MFTPPFFPVTMECFLGNNRFMAPSDTSGIFYVNYRMGGEILPLRRMV
jgi:hypothetical protein